MKIRVEETKRGLKYELVDSILKTHFKALMKLSHYTAYTKTGEVYSEDKAAFLELVEKIEKSNTARARTSHAKTAEKYKERKASAAQGKCEHEDLGSLGYKHGTFVRCPNCGQTVEVW